MKCCATGKIRHPTKEGACFAAKRHKSNLLNVYKCCQCGAWHIGNSNNPYRFQKRLDQIFARDRKRTASAGEAGTAKTTEIGLAEGEHATLEEGDAQTIPPVRSSI